MGSIGLKTPYPAQGICDGFISSNFRESIVKGCWHRRGRLPPPPPPPRFKEWKKQSPLLSSPYSLLGRLDGEKLMPLFPCRMTCPVLRRPFLNALSYLFTLQSFAFMILGTYRVFEGVDVGIERSGCYSNL